MCIFLDTQQHMTANPEMHTGWFVDTCMHTLAFICTPTLMVYPGTLTHKLRGLWIGVQLKTYKKCSSKNKAGRLERRRASPMVLLFYGNNAIRQIFYTPPG